MHFPTPADPQARPRCSSTRAFTLVELLVAMSVLVLITAMLMGIVNGTTATTVGSRLQIEADQQARTVFDRLATDLAAMPKRSDVDFLFAKQDSVEGATDINDKLFFYSEVPGYFPSVSTDQTRSPMALIGYQITGAAQSGTFQLARLSKGLSWSTLQGTGPMTLLTTGSGSTSFEPLSASTIAGNTNWSEIIGTSPTYQGTAYKLTDTDSSVFGEDIFRFEFCYQLKDGSYSRIPVMSGTAATAAFKYYKQTAAPTASDDNTKQYKATDRWYDDTGKRAYICVSAATGAAVWQPLGLDDVSALVVATASLDPADRARVPQFSTLAEKFKDPTDAELQANPPQLMAETWLKVLKPNTLGIPNTVAAQIHVYQRSIPINPQ